MKNTVSFKNNGLIELSLIRTFGASVKDSEDSMGIFGTGIKYAISVILNHGCTITLYRGKTKHEFATRIQEIRGKAIEFFTMDGVDLPFTSNLGRSWTLWQAYRELYCNALDEGGTHYPTELEPESGTTTIVVTGDKFMNVYENRNSYFLDTKNTKLIKSTDNCDIYYGSTHAVFYRGIRVYTTEPDKPTNLTYNITKPTFSLTEERWAKFHFEVRHCIRDAFVQITTPSIIRDTIAKNGYETKEIDDYSESSEICPEFTNYVMELKDTERTIVPESLIAMLIKAHGSAGRDLMPCTLNNVEQKQLRIAIKFLKKLGYTFDYKIIVVNDLGRDILGLACDQTIYIAKAAFELGTKQVATVLFEEFLHLRDGLLDETRRMQNALTYIIMTLGERVIGEPL